MSSIRSDRRGLALAIIAVLVIVIIVIAALLVVFLPFREVTVNETRSSTFSDGLTSLDLELSIDHGTVEVRFADNPGDAVSMTVTGKEFTNFISSKEPVNVSWSQSMDGSALKVVSKVSLGGIGGFLSSGRINCTVTIAKQLKTSLAIDNNVGAIDIKTVDGVELTGANITTSTGGARVGLVKNTTLSGPLTVGASVGGVDLSWNDVNATGDARVRLSSSTGGIRAVFDQREASIGNVSVDISANVGGIDATMDIAGDVSGKVVSSASTGGVNVREQTGFNGTSGQLESENYPTGSQISMTCTTQTGGVNLSVRYTA